ncbi:MAG: 2-dehydro-3-deoxy-D-gluconate 5-dehydrogenase KduD [Ruminococcaceae bacterium]|nr:2-dehydro-3-deoxy-D-gluconate 5-dehydrogenase KduD [Oscillospiraceae bacterium]
MFSLKGKTAIITGANTGLGQAMCVALSKAGANIVGVARREMDDTEKLVKQNGTEFYPVIADLGTTEPIERIIKDAVNRFGRIDILVNNAGIIRREDAIDYSENDWDDVVNINLKTLYFLSQAAAKQFVKQKSGGKIINIASMLSYQGGIRVPAYTASKHAVMGATKAMANEWAKYNINVNAIAPGYMATNNTEQLRNDTKRYNEILERIPAGRWGEPSDIGGTVVFLASSAADYIHGFTIAVDGGWLSR